MSKKELDILLDSDTLPATIDDVTAGKALAVFESENGLTPFYEHVEKAAKEAVEGLDANNEKDRKKMREVARLVSSSKTLLEKPCRAYLKQIKEKVKPIEANAKQYVDSMNALRDLIKQPADEYDAEQERQRQVKQDAIDCYSQSIDILREDIATAANADKIVCIQNVTETISKYDTSLAGDRIEEAEKAKADAIETLNGMLALVEKQITEEKAAQEARDEKIRKQAAEDAAKANEAALRQAELDKQLAEQAAKTERENAEKRAQLAADTARQEAEKAAAEKVAQQEAEAKARAEDREHRAKVNGEILRKMIELGLDEDAAKTVITAAVKGELGQMKVAY